MKIKTLEINANQEDHIHCPKLFGYRKSWNFNLPERMFCSVRFEKGLAAITSPTSLHKDDGMRVRS